MVIFRCVKDDELYHSGVKGMKLRYLDSKGKKESLVRSVRNTIDNNRVGKNIDYKNVYKILSGK